MEVKEQKINVQDASSRRDTGLQQMLESVTQFPPWPSALGKILAEFDREDLDSSRLAQMISREVAILSKLLRVANSPFYGVSGNIANALQAINTIGLSNTRSIVLAVAVMSTLPPNIPREFDQQAFWQEAIGVAVAAEWLGRRFALKDCDPFTAGMLHDIGKILIAFKFPKHYAAIQQAVALDPQAKAFDLEQAQLGFTHAEAGAAIAEQWNFPAALIEGICWHHTPSPTHHPLTTMLAIGNKIARLCHVEGLSSDAIRTAVGDLAGEFTLKDSEWQALLNSTRTQSAALGAML